MIDFGGTSKRIEHLIEQEDKAFSGRTMRLKMPWQQPRPWNGGGGKANQLLIVATDFLLCDLCVPALWIDTWWVFDLAWFAAMTGVVTRAVTGTTNVSAAIRRLNEVITSVCSGG